MRKSLVLALLLLLPWATGPAATGSERDLHQLLQDHACRGCNLADMDLMHADLREADLQGAELQRTNLTQAILDGADLSGSDLSFTNLRGASLREADLRGCRLYGTDLRSADLSGALLDGNALAETYWSGAHGIADGARSHAGLHNAGVDAAQAGRWSDAELLFSMAIQAKPDEPLSWVARGLSRGEQGKNDLASRDLSHAGHLFVYQGDAVKGEQLLEASQRAQVLQDGSDMPTSEGIGSTLLSGAFSAAQALAPIALRALMPIVP